MESIAVSALFRAGLDVLLGLLELEFVPGHLLLGELQLVCQNIIEGSSAVQPLPLQAGLDPHVRQEAVVVVAVLDNLQLPRLGP